MNRIKILAVSGLLLGVSSLLAQEAGIVALSLKECVKQAVDNNINAVKARIDREKKGNKFVLRGWGDICQASVTY